MASQNRGGNNTGKDLLLGWLFIYLFALITLILLGASSWPGLSKFEKWALIALLIGGVTNILVAIYKTLDERDWYWGRRYAEIRSESKKMTISTTIVFMLRTYLLFATLITSVIYIGSQERLPIEIPSPVVTIIEVPYEPGEPGTDEGDTSGNGFTGLTEAIENLEKAVERIANNITDGGQFDFQLTTINLNSVIVIGLSLLVISNLVIGFAASNRFGGSGSTFNVFITALASTTRWLAIAGLILTLSGIIVDYYVGTLNTKPTVIVKPLDVNMTVVVDYPTFPPPTDTPTPTDTIDTSMPTLVTPPPIIAQTPTTQIYLMECDTDIWSMPNSKTSFFGGGS